MRANQARSGKMWDSSEPQRSVARTSAGLFAVLAMVVLGGSFASAQTPNVPRSAIFPKVVHHQHLLSPIALGDTTPAAPPPEVKIPIELTRLLEERLAILGSPEVTDLYTEDAQIHGARWIRGRPAIHAQWARWNRRPDSRLVPNTYALGDDVGFVAGTAGHMEEGVFHHSQNFMMALRRGDDGEWRIAAETLTDIPPPTYSAPLVASSLVTQMDDAGVERGVVLSLAYHFARSPTEVEGEWALVQAENDWTSQQAASFPDRLVGFCGINPLRDYALAELDRCRRLPQMIGAKLHFGADRIDLQNPDHVARLGIFFSGANARGTPVIVHMGMDLSHGREHAEIFLAEVLPSAPDIVIQIAHLAGGGRYDRFATDSALAVFAHAAADGSPLMHNVYFDTTGILTESTPPEVAALAAQRMREIGLDRILFGTDMAPEPTPLQAWSLFRRKLPLTDEELAIIASNVAPYLRPAEGHGDE